MFTTTKLKKNEKELEHLSKADQVKLLNRLLGIKGLYINA